MNYPILFTPIVKDRLWGGQKLKKLFNKPSQTLTTGESWEISGVQGDVSVVANGHLQGQTLQDLINTQPIALLGASVFKRFGREFPILIKFIDAQLDLSIQLHPNDQLARERHNSFGKTEMWYVMDADPGSRLIVGFNRDVTKEEYTTALQSGRLMELMNEETVKKGDTFFINTGKIHAIGAGVLLAEIQQTSDVTYRVYDFDRKDKAGNLRELHTDLALDALDYQYKEDFKVAYQTRVGRGNPMVDSPYFKTSYLPLEQSQSLFEQQRDHFTIYLCVEGEVVLQTKEGEARLVAGTSCLIPASVDFLKVETTGATLLEVWI